MTTKNENPKDKNNCRELLIYPHALRERQFYPDTARALVAKACDGKPVAPIIFNRDDEGKTLQRGFDLYGETKRLGATPSICFDGGLGFIRLYGIGKEGREALFSEGAKVAMAISSLAEGAFRLDMREAKCVIQSGATVPYRIRNLIVSKNRTEYAGIAEGRVPDLSEMTPLIRKAIYRGLLGQAMALDEDMNTNMALGIPEMDMLDIQIFEGTPVFTPIKKGKAYALAVHGLVFTMNLRLKGPWFVGHLRSRGFGLIRANREA